MCLDYHIHTSLCGHARGRPEEYLQQAVRTGLKEIGFADHAPLPPDATRLISRSVPFKKIAMSPGQLSRYTKEILRLKKKSTLPVRLGMEVDFFPRSRSVFRLLGEHDFDYFIGSVHFADHWGFDQEEFLDETERYGFGRLMRRYLGLIREMASTRLFDIVGHLDLPKKFGRRPGKGCDAEFRRTLRVIRENRMAVELNTSGLERPVGEIYPSPALLKQCFELDIPVTLGSDAHAPEQVGRHFAKARTLLKKIGYTRLASFRNHILTPVPF